MKKLAEKYLNLFEGINDQNIFKAIIMAGGPGSGKGFVLDKVLAQSDAISAFGAKIINSDDFFERGLLKRDLGLKLDLIPEEVRDRVRAIGKATANSKLSNVLNGMLPVVLDGTGKDKNKIKGQKEGLENLGYDVSLIFVNTSLPVALERNRKRKRSLSDKATEELWQKVQDNIGAFQTIFKNKFHIVDNTKMLEGPELKKFSDRLYKIGKKALTTPLKNKIGLETIEFMKTNKMKLLNEINPEIIKNLKVKV
jgi:adenylate kinase